MIPYITEIRMQGGGGVAYPYSIPAIASMKTLELRSPVTFFVGKNGSGKSTLLEAVAVNCGFSPEGGSKNMTFATYDSHSSLWESIKLVRGPRRPKDGFFLRAESFYNVATHIEELDAVPAPAPKIKASYGGSLHERSHGESFAALFFKRLGTEGLYLLDEPEAALGIDSQLSALTKIKELAENGSQFIIATHSPILTAYPGGEIYSFDNERIERVKYEETDIYRIYKYFLNNHTKMLKELGL